MIASAAVTTGLFVLAGVVVGGLVTGAVNYVFERRRDGARLQVAMRLLESELLISGVEADWRIEDEEWSPWNFESALSAWHEYRPDIARLPEDDWYSVSRGFFNIELVERRFSTHAAGKLDAQERKELNKYALAVYEGANTLRSRQGLAAIGRRITLVE